MKSIFAQFFFLLKGSPHSTLFYIFSDPASILHVSDVVLVAERQTAILNCTVDGNPLSSEHVYWRRDDFPMAAKTRSSFANITSSLTVYNVTLNDMGNFYCVVDNGIGGESNKSAFLVVKREYLHESE